MISRITPIYVEIKTGQPKFLEERALDKQMINEDRSTSSELQLLEFKLLGLATVITTVSTML